MSSVAQKLSKIADEAVPLEDIAKRVQETDENEAGRITAQLEDAYGKWYARALTILPKDLTSSFESEFNGSIFQPKIKQFIQEPRKPALQLDLPPELATAIGPWAHSYTRCFRGPLMTQKQIILNAIARSGIGADTVDSLELLEGACRNLPHVMTLLRHDHKSGFLTFTDEYDVQHLLHALLVFHFSDVRPEEFSPSRAGSNTRIDFILPDVRVAVEVKMTRRGLDGKKLGDELAADILRYRAHPDTSALFCVIFDPDRRVSNPVGFEKDISRSSDDFPVRAVICH
ncbi:hypothetical protein ACFV0C_12945 [Streptomyces sp. NPDC059568]|uniref:PD-(D/E)XK nuclease domain-containing protein n=1 Tax=Streptomyces sp. NPDC059568 TaxID=3346868 RepID=UPI00367E149E